MVTVTAATVTGGGILTTAELVVVGTGGAAFVKDAGAGAGDGAVYGLCTA